MIEVTDFTATGWHPPEAAAARARACCAQLERGAILMLREPSLMLSGADQEVLTHVSPAAVAHKNIAYQPDGGELRGLRRGTAGGAIKAALARYCERAVALCAALLAPYASAWRIELTSFRPLEEEGRRLARRQRNDLLHIDSFPSRPTNGARILRCFTNLHPSRPRIWATSDPFPSLSPALLQANLAAVTRRGRSPWRWLTRGARLGGYARSAASPYDEFMLSLHDRMKRDRRYAAAAPRFTHTFPPGATWLVFTDGVPHAVMAGRFALEQTFFVPRAALLAPDDAPVAILERLAGRPLTA